MWARYAVSVLVISKHSSKWESISVDVVVLVDRELPMELKWILLA